MRFQYSIKFEVRQDVLVKMPTKTFEMWEKSSRERLGYEMKILEVIDITILKFFSKNRFKIFKEESKKKKKKTS